MTKKKNPKSQKGKGKAPRKALFANANVPGVGTFSGGYTDADYFAPVSQGKSMRMVNPQMKSNKNGNLRITRREYIADMSPDPTGAGLFEIDEFRVNPGLPTSFPWLSRLAINFEKYRFHKLVFSFQTESPSTYSGTVMLAASYDVHDSIPVSKQEILGQSSSSRSPPWAPNSFAMDLVRMGNQLRLIRSGLVPVGADSTLYDAGSFQFASQGVADGGTGITTSIGELWVEYDVELAIPATPSAQEEASVGSYLHKSTGTNIVSIAGETYGSLPIEYSTVNALLFKQAGQYEVLVSAKFTAAATNTFNITAADGLLFSKTTAVEISNTVHMVSFSVVTETNDVVVAFTSTGAGVISFANVLICECEEPASKNNTV